MEDTPWALWKQGTLKLSKPGTTFGKKFKDRFFVLKSHNKDVPATLLRYKNEKERTKKQDRAKEFRVGGCSVRVIPKEEMQPMTKEVEKLHFLELTHPEQQKLILASEDEDELQSWMDALLREGAKEAETLNEQVRWRGYLEQRWALAGPFASTTLNEEWHGGYYVLLADNDIYVGNMYRFKSEQEADKNLEDKTRIPIPLSNVRMTIYKKKVRAVELYHVDRGSVVLHSDNETDFKSLKKALDEELDKPEKPSEKNDNSSMKLLVSTIKEIGLNMGDWSAGELTIGLAMHARRQAKERRIPPPGENLSREFLWYSLFFVKHAWASYELSEQGFCKWTGLQKDHLIAVNFVPMLLRPAYYVAVDHRIQGIVVAIRGTDSIKDALTDLHAAADPWRDGYAHRGMAQAATWFDNNIKGIVKTQLQKHPDYALYIVGHSLGGGTSTLLSMMWRSSFPNLTCFAYATAACASADMALYCEHYINTFVHRDDIVPRFSTLHMEDLRREIDSHPWWDEFTHSIKKSRLAKTYREIQPALETYKKTTEETLEKLGVFEKLKALQTTMKQQGEKLEAKYKVKEKWEKKLEPSLKEKFENSKKVGKYITGGYKKEKQQLTLPEGESNIAEHFSDPLAKKGNASPVSEQPDGRKPRSESMASSGSESIAPIFLDPVAKPSGTGDKQEVQHLQKLFPPGKCYFLYEGLDHSTRAKPVRSDTFDKIVLSTHMVMDHRLGGYQKRLEDLLGMKIEDVDLPPFRIKHAGTVGDGDVTEEIKKRPESVNINHNLFRSSDADLTALEEAEASGASKEELAEFFGIPDVENVVKDVPGVKMVESDDDPSDSEAPSTSTATKEGDLLDI